MAASVPLSWLNIVGQMTRRWSFFGKMWFMVVFLFRIVAGFILGTLIFWDEEARFQCGTQSAGCNQDCFNLFTPITLRTFWLFQLLAVTSPMVVFNLLVAPLCKKLVQSKKQTNAQEDQEIPHQSEQEGKQDNITVEKAALQNKGQLLKKILVKNLTSIAYFVAVVLSLTIEIVFLYFTSLEYNYTDSQPEIISSLLDMDFHLEGSTTLDFLLPTYPKLYPCRPSARDSLLCAQHAVQSSGFVIPCSTSRAFEKTLLIRYMNILSVICFFLCLLEILWLMIKLSMHFLEFKKGKFQVSKNLTKYQDSKV